MTPVAAYRETNELCLDTLNRPRIGKYLYSFYRSEKARFMHVQIKNLIGASDEQNAQNVVQYIE